MEYDHDDIKNDDEKVFIYFYFFGVWNDVVKSFLLVWSKHLYDCVLCTSVYMHTLYTFVNYVFTFCTLQWRREMKRDG